jgi:hypothetical protein
MVILEGPRVDSVYSGLGVLNGESESDSLQHAPYGILMSDASQQLFNQTVLFITQHNAVQPDANSS